MRFVALVLIISLTSCTIVGGVIGGVSASNHNASRPPLDPTQPALVEAPACAVHRRELEAAANQELDPARRNLALHSLPNCMVPDPHPHHEDFHERDVTYWVLGGAVVGLAIDFSLLVLRAYTLSDGDAD